MALAAVPMRLPLASGLPAARPLPVLLPIRLKKGLAGDPGRRSGAVPLSLFWARMVLRRLTGPASL